MTGGKLGGCTRFWVAGNFGAGGGFFKEMGGQGVKAGPGVTQVHKTPARR